MGYSVGQCGQLGPHLPNLRRVIVFVDGKEKGQMGFIPYDQPLPEGAVDVPPQESSAFLGGFENDDPKTSLEFCQDASSSNFGLFAYTLNKCQLGNTFGLQEIPGLVLNQMEISALLQLGLGSSDICMHDNAPGHYKITKDTAALSQIMDGLANSSNLPMTPDRRQEVINAIFNLPSMEAERQISANGERAEKGLEVQEGTAKWLPVTAMSSLASLGIIAYFLHKQTKKMNDVMDNNAEISGDNLRFEDLVVDEFETQMDQWKRTGTFEQPYVDTDGVVRDIVSVFDTSQGDQSNYQSVGPSRAGKTASTVRGITQAMVFAQMNEDERAAFFEKTNERLSPEEAEAFRSSLEGNAAAIQKLIGKRGLKGIKIYNLPIPQLKAKSAIWVNKDTKVLTEKVMDPVFRKAAEGYHVVLFMDEIQQAEDGDQMKGVVALRDRIKEFAEKSPRVSFGQATTVDEYEQTIAQDKASVNRYNDVFHAAASPAKSIQILRLKPYIKNDFGVESIESDAMKAIYLLGQKVDTKPSAHSAAEMYLRKVLQAAEAEGRTHVDARFVFDHFDENYSAKVGGRDQVSPETLDASFDWEVWEVEDANAETVKRLRSIKLEAGRAVRVNPPWYEVSPELFSERPLSEAIDAVKAKVADPAGAPYEAKASPEAVESSGRLAEGLYRPAMQRLVRSIVSREEAMHEILGKASEIAVAEGTGDMSASHLIRAAGDLLSMPIEADHPEIQWLLDRSTSIAEIQKRSMQEMAKFAAASRAVPMAAPKAQRALSGARTATAKPAQAQASAAAEPQLKLIVDSMKADGVVLTKESHYETYASYASKMLEGMSEQQRAHFMNPDSGRFYKGRVAELCELVFVEAKKSPFAPADLPKVEVKKGEAKSAAKQDAAKGHMEPLDPTKAKKIGEGVAQHK